MTSDGVHDLDLNPLRPYTVLGVEPDAPLEDIKRRFQNEVLKFHPDKFGSDITPSQRAKLEDHCRLLIRSYRLVKRDKMRAGSVEELARQRRAVPAPSAGARDAEPPDLTRRFDSVDAYLSFEVPKPDKRAFDSRDFNSEFDRRMTRQQRGAGRAMVLRTADGFSGYNVDDLQTVATGVDGRGVVFQHALTFDGAV